MEWLIGSGVFAWVKDMLSKRQPQVQINLSPGATYNDFRGAKGEFHVHLDGKAEIVSPTPIRIAGIGTSAVGGSATPTLTRKGEESDDG